MELKEKLEILNKLYDIHDDYSAEMEVACHKRCDSCCTCNVVIGSLEGLEIMEYLKKENKEDFLDELEFFSKRKYYRPPVTANGLAELCISGGEMPEEGEHGPGSCLFLENKACQIYPVRPFECRSLLSETDCRKVGYASMDPIHVSVVNLFKQYIEHLDVGGVYGNLIDVIFFHTNGNQAEFLLKGKAMPMPLVPPDHLPQIQDVLKALREVFTKKAK